MVDYNERNLQGRFARLDPNWDSLTPHEKMEKLDVFYSNNSLYDELATYAKDNDYWLEAIKPIRNPTTRSVDFFASKLMMGKPKILVTNQRPATLTAIEQFLAWSGFELNKRAVLRKYALYGDNFFKVNFDGSKVFQTTLNAKHVTSFREDDRHFLEEIRIDVPLDHRKTHTELWTMDGQYVSVWEHTGNRDTPTDRLGDPIEFVFFDQWGIDFIPITHAKFKDIGDAWGRSCIDHAVEKIEEWDRKATVLSEMMFQSDQFLILRNSASTDPKLPKPMGNIVKPTDSEAQRFSRFKVFKAPNVDEVLKSSLDYAWTEFLAILKDDEESISQDLPELRYYQLKENELSGIAIRTLLAGALDRAKEAQENLTNQQERTTAMGLTLGRNMGLFPREIGDFDNGDFEHSLGFEEIIPAQSQTEKITALASLANVDMPIQVKMTLSGFSPEEIALVATPQE